jgi:hypothetical protein
MHEAAEAMLRDIQVLLCEDIESGEFRPDVDLSVVPLAIGSLKLLHFDVDIATAGLISHE